MSHPNLRPDRPGRQITLASSGYRRVDDALATRWGTSESQARLRRLRLLSEIRDILAVESPDRQEILIDEISQVVAGVPVVAAEADLRRLELHADTDEDRAEGDYHLSPTIENRERHRRSLARQGACSLALARALGDRA